ncbi:MAG: 3-oxoacyl-[acyl-carrier-protein] reductase [Clostridiaceae bacterium]|nr:3-oxoacyl-[acyl-carrier-protein] reductase [Clostridiaceae bacterium]
MLNGKTVVITGASRGIGAAIARKFASLGANIAVIYAQNHAAAEEVCRVCAETNGIKAVPLCCDTSDFSAVKQTVAEIKAVFGTIDILVNNAGITRDGLVAVMREKDFDDVLAVNLKGAFNMIRHCSPILIRNKGGKIINIGSVVGLTGNAGQVNYAAAKAGLVGLTKAVARELSGKNITCNAIAPGFIQTDMTKDLNAESGLLSGIPLGRPGTPEDVAEAVAFLAGPGADYITGEVLRVDGGLAM